jgi:phosphoglycolate phosphatase
MRVIDSIGDLIELIGGPRKWHRATRGDHAFAAHDMPMPN